MLHLPHVPRSLLHLLVSPQFVELPEFLAERAVQLLHNRNMQNRYIEVFVSSEAEANQANIAPPMQLPGMKRLHGQHVTIEAGGIIVL